MAAAYVRESETSSFRRSGCCLSLVNNLRSAAPDRSIDRISFARNATQSTEAVRPPMSITQSKCMTSLVVRGVDGRTDGRARARTSAKFRSPRDISPSHCAILLPASVDHPLAAGPPSFLPSFLPAFLPSFFPSLFLSFTPASFAARQRVSLGRIASGSDTLSLASTAPPSPAARRLRPISSNTQRRRRSFSKWDLRGRLSVCAFVRPRAILLHLSSRLLRLEVVRV